MPGGRVANAPTKLVSVAQPGAGADWTYTLTYAAEIQGAGAQLVTNSTAASRTPVLKITDGSGDIEAELGNGAAQTASLTSQWTWAPTSASLTSAPYLVPFPAGLVLPSGFKIATVTANIQTTDQWSAIWLALVAV